MIFFHVKLYTMTTRYENCLTVDDIAYITNMSEVADLKDRLNNNGANKMKINVTLSTEITNKINNTFNISRKLS